MELQRFKDAQTRGYDMAITELQNGRKTGHWMWYIFPQLTGLGMTDTSRFYAIKDIHEASGYLVDELLGLRLVNCCKTLLALDTNNAYEIFGTPDDLKLRSCMTLFDAVPATFPVFGQVLDKFYHGKRDQRTLYLLGI